MKSLSKNKVLVSLSGGQDSAVCLLQAKKLYKTVYAVSFNYGQKNSVELDCARKIAELLKTEHFVLDIPALKQIGDSALLTGADMNELKDGLPASFVPARNIIFLSQAAALAYKLDCGFLVTGVGEADYSGYPDCREKTINSLNETLNLAMETNLEIITPLMHKTKAEIWAMAQEYDLELIREHTHTCYNGDRVHRHDWGYGCGACPACQLRKNGYEKFMSGLKK